MIEVSSACEDVFEQAEEFLPTPRGLDLHLEPGGYLRVIWETVHHVLTLTFESKCGMVKKEYVRLSCAYQDEKSDRLAIVQS